MGDAVLGRTTQEKDLGVTFSADILPKHNTSPDGVPDGSAHDGFGPRRRKQ